jgi:ABC-type uncharacterized transport system substrate-binding protein
MRRRDFITLLGSAAVASPLVARAQQGGPGMPLVAVLMPGAAELNEDRIAALRRGLRDAGLIEDKNYALALRYANGDFERLPPLAKELAALKPQVFVAAANAAQTVHALLPEFALVFTGIAADPVAIGFAQNYVRPGGTATGNIMNAIGGEEAITGKRIGFFKELVPNLTRLFMIGTTNNLLAISEQNALRTASDHFGFEFVHHPIQTLDDVAGALSTGVRAGASAFYISGVPLLLNNISRVMPLVAASGTPTVGVYPEWARAGLLMSYSSDLADGFRHAGTYVAKILAGEKPGDLPIEQASKFTLVINLKTAKGLGIDVPPTLLSLAEEVIE